VRAGEIPGENISEGGMLRGKCLTLTYGVQLQARSNLNPTRATV